MRECENCGGLMAEIWHNGSTYTLYECPDCGVKIGVDSEDNILYYAEPMLREIIDEADEL